MRTSLNIVPVELIAAKASIHYKIAAKTGIHYKIMTRRDFKNSAKEIGPIYFLLTNRVRSHLYIRL